MTMSIAAVAAAAALVVVVIHPTHFTISVYSKNTHTFFIRIRVNLKSSVPFLVVVLVLFFLMSSRRRE